jgi:hypothetical protein
MWFYLLYSLDLLRILCYNDVEIQHRIKTALHFNRFKGFPISIIRQTSFLWMEGYQMVIAALIAVGFKYFAKKKSTAV